MPKIIQLKNGSENVFPKIVFKSVRGINLEAGKEYIDKDILNASLVIVYFTVTTTRYRNQFVIPKGDDNWFMDVTNNWITYVYIDWKNRKSSNFINEYRERKSLRNRI